MTMRYDFIKVPNIAGNIPDSEIEKVRVDRENELSNIVHLTTKVNENILLTGDRGQGKSFLAILFHKHLIQNHPEIFPVRIDLTALHFNRNDESFIKLLPALILDQLCKEIWVSLFNNDYSALLNTSDNIDKVNLYKNNSEKRLIEIHNILKREEQKFCNELKSMMSGVKSEINTGEKTKWQNRTLQNFEHLELIREIKNTILKENSRTKIMLICDEANKLTEKEQYYILQNYLDFFGANQFNFLLVTSNFNKLKSTAEQSGLLRVIELGGFCDVKLVKELINKSFETNSFTIDDKVYDIIYKAFSGHIRLTTETFLNCIRIMLDDNKKIIDIKIGETAIENMTAQIRQWEKLNLNMT